MNRLRHETSPYLLQHADNPVDWYPWGAEALEKARAEDKPILVSIGYATCHWCHVMERESFRDQDIAAFMNHHFVNIKIDREERPDLDQLYMEAGHLLNRTSGWPLNCFLTPEGKPFFAGSYFPPEPGPKQMAWYQALQYAQYNFRENRAAVEHQADRTIQALERQNQEAQPYQPASFFESPFPTTLADEAFQSLQKRFDDQYGGFGDAPKFPDLLQLRFLLHYHYHTQSKEALDHLLLSLDRMIRGGIYDIVGGGLARYATDRAWKVPHFEKMLNDNALFAQLLADVYSLTGEERWKTHLEETLQFMRRELRSAEGAFYSGLDAESEGLEGKFYTWTYDELKVTLSPSLLGHAMRFFEASPEGNWENGLNILHQPHPIKEDEAVLFRQIVDLLAKARATRTRPRRDTKILLGWNALTALALARGYEVTGHTPYREDAIRLVRYLLQTFPTDDNRALYRVAAQGMVHHPGLLQDYAYFIQALLATHRITWETSWLESALDWVEKTMEQFQDPEGALLFVNPAWQKDLVVRSKDTHDLELPSGNAAFADALRQLGLLLSRRDLTERAARMLLVLKGDLEAHPAAYGAWLCQWLTEAYGANEVVLIGEKAVEWANEMRSRFIPNAVLLPSKVESDRLPLWEGRTALAPAGIYVCQEQACMRPVNDLEAGLQLVCRSRETDTRR